MPYGRDMGLGCQLLRRRGDEARGTAPPCGFTSNQSRFAVIGVIATVPLCKLTDPIATAQEYYRN